MQNHKAVFCRVKNYAKNHCKEQTKFVCYRSYSTCFIEGQQPRPVQYHPDALVGPGIAKSVNPVLKLEHGEVVCAITISNSIEHVFTGGKGCVKIWGLNTNGRNNGVVEKHKPITDFRCLGDDNYVRSMKLLPDGNTLLVGGESKTVSVWDLSGPSPKLKVRPTSLF